VAATAPPRGRGTPKTIVITGASDGIGAAACYRRHRHQEFLRFLKKVAAAHPAVELHVILDNYGTRKHPEVRRWLADNPRITPATSAASHSSGLKTPTSSSP
jgi:NAD(P)-dependent dehydrogenase (short-subunit alcohol dehydrogenase family)